MSCRQRDYGPAAFRLIVGYVVGFAVAAFFSFGHLKKSVIAFSVGSFSRMFATLAVSALLEESVFRFAFYRGGDLLLSKIRIIGPGFRRIAACLFSSFLFSLAHIRNAEVSVGSKPVVLCIYFTAGVYFCAVYDFFGCIAVPFVVHFVNNALSTFVVSIECAGSAYSAYVMSIDPDSAREVISVLLPQVMSLLMLFCARYRPNHCLSR